MTLTHVLQFLEYVRQKRGKNDARTTKFGVRASVGERRGKVVGGPRPGSRGEGQREAEEGRSRNAPAEGKGAGRSEGADFCKFAGTVNLYGGSCGCLVEAFGNSRGFDRQAFFRRHLAFRRPGEFYGCLLCRSIEGVEV